MSRLTNTVRWSPALVALLALCAGIVYFKHHRPARWVIQRVAYDNRGRLLSRESTGRVATGYHYDADGRLQEVTGGDGTVRVGYDSEGSLSSIQSRVGTVAFEYDRLSRLATLRAPFGASLSYEYDPWGRVAAITVSGGSKIAYERDVLGRIITVHDGKGLTFFEYSEHKIVRRLPNGIRSTFVLTAAGQPVFLRHEAPDGALMVEYQYSRDPEGHITAIEESTPHGHRLTRYGYDSAGRLVSITLPSGKKQTYGYDALGNRLWEELDGAPIVYRYSEGLLTRRGTTEIDYNRAGNLVALRDGTRSARLTYGDGNRLVAVRKGSSEIRYAYDGLGERVSRTLNGSAVYFLNDISLSREEVAAEYDPSGRVTTQYLLAGRAFGERARDGNTFYYLEDHLGSVRDVVDSRGSVVAHYDYQPFGEPTSTAANGPRFAGEMWDAEAGILYLRGRYLDTQTGRFLSRDRFAGLMTNPQSFNRYAYAQNDPVNLVDPSGLSPEAPVVPSRYDPRTTRNLQQWWQNWAVGQLSKNPSGIGGRLAAGVSATEYAFLEKYLAPMETKVRELADPQYVAEHPIKRFATGIGLAADAAGLLPISPAPSAIKANFASDIPLLDRLQVFQTGEHWTQTRTYLPFGLDRLYLSSQSLRFSLDKAKDVFDLGKESLSLVHELGNNAASQKLAQPEVAPVGGVRLDKSVAWLGALNSVTGAVYDQQTGRVVLVGEKRTTLPAMRPDDLAVALRAIWGGGDVSMSIDPDARDPKGPIMHVAFFGQTENTHLGLVMFEADRVMKGLSVGRDNITKAPLTLDVEGYRNLSQLKVASSNGQAPRLWSRFWLVPDRLTLRVSADGHSVAFEETRMRVKTETMRWDGMRLVSAGGVKDAAAEEFAAHFTARYDEIGRKFPIFAELKRLAQVVALARWMKDNSIPIDPRWVEQFLSGGDSTPNTTPSVTNTFVMKASRQTTHVSVFGGAILSAEPAYRVDDPGMGVFVRNVKVALDRAGGQPAFDLTTAGGRRQAVVLPTTDARIVETFLDKHCDLETVDGGVELCRFYSSFHTEPSSVGRGWSLLLPKLYSQNSTTPPQTISLPGHVDSGVTVRDYFLTDSFGLRDTRFETHFVDPELERIGFRARGSSPYRGLFPFPEGDAILILNHGGAWGFDAKGRATEAWLGNTQSRYEYDSAGRMVQIGGRAGHSIRIEYGTDGRIARAVADGGAETRYTYDPRGFLTTVTTPKGKISYRYSGDKRLQAILENDRPVTQVVYSAEGVLVKDGAGKTISQRHQTGSEVDTMDIAGRTTRYQFAETGSVRKVQVTTAKGDRTTAEWNPEQRRLSLVSVRGGQKDFILDQSGRVASITIDGSLFVAYVYHGADRTAEYENFEEKVQFDPGGRARYSVRPKRFWSRPDGDSPLREVTPGREEDSVAGVGPAPRAKLNYDGARLKSVADGSGALATYSYDLRGRLIMVALSNGTEIVYEYDSADRVTRVIETAR